MKKLNVIQLVSLLLVALFFTAYKAAAADAEIQRAILTTAIESREPVDNLNAQTVSSETTKLYFFTEALNLANTQISHRWFFNGKLEAEVALNIGSNRWRTYSSKNLVPAIHSGDWTVEVVNNKGKLLTTQSFTYQ